MTHIPTSHALTFSILAGACIVQQLLITAHGSCQIIVAVALASASLLLLFSFEDIICARCICGVSLR